jgi:iron only hydrogenase large subunit-like protein
MIKLKNILSESKIEIGKVYPNPYHTAFKSESQIKEEENSVNEADDHEVGMGLSALKESVRSAKIIYDEIKKRNIQELEGWVQHKLTLASDYLNTVAQYMEDLDEYDGKDK